MPPSIRRWATHPAVLYTLAWTLLLAILFAPLWTGGVILNPMSDGKDGYVTRHFAAEMIAQWGEVPRWNSYIFGGMPFLGAMHGDQVYPVSVALRAIFPPALGIGLGMLLHLWAGALGLLVFLRKQPLSWTAAMVGATAYGLGGPFLSLFFPGHDGKIYVLGMLPWAMTAILLAARTLRPTYFAAWGALIGLMLLSPHFQMTYYASLLMGAFVILCLVTELDTPRRRLLMLAGMGVASVFGLMLAAAQLMPFVEYLPFSPRSAAGSSSTGWEYATSWAMPAVELIGTLWGGFNGWLLETYWGTNAFKLHSDYLGLLTGVLALTALILTPKGPSRRVIWFFAGAVGFGVLWVLGGQTPFYQLPYHLLPGIAKTRAASMMWGQVSMCVAVLAAYGVYALETMPAERRGRWARRTSLATGIVVAILLLVSGSLIPGLAVFGRQDAAYAAIAGARLGLLLGGVTVVAVAVAAQRTPRWLWAVAVAMLVIDLAGQGRRFIRIDERGEDVFAADGVVQAVQADAAGTTQPWRLLPLGLGNRPAGPYTDDYLMEHRIRSTFGYHGNELHNYDELLGGKNVWSQRVNPRIWDVAAVRYIVTEQPLENSGLVPVAADVRTWLGEPAWVWRVPNPAPWARVVPAGAPDPERGRDAADRDVGGRVRPAGARTGGGRRIVWRFGPAGCPAAAVRDAAHDHRGGARPGNVRIDHRRPRAARRAHGERELGAVVDRDRGRCGRSSGPRQRHLPRGAGSGGGEGSRPGPRGARGP